jgi:hypothetical protein
MTIRGFEEAQSSFVPADTRQFIGEVRRFGPFGPAYEVVDTAPEREMTIIVIETGEKLQYPLADLLADPMAETVP